MTSNIGRAARELLETLTGPSGHSFEAEARDAGRRAGSDCRLRPADIQALLAARARLGDAEWARDLARRRTKSKPLDALARSEEAGEPGVLAAWFDPAAVSRWLHSCPKGPSGAPGLEDGETGPAAQGAGDDDRVRRVQAAFIAGLLDARREMS